MFSQLIHMLRIILLPLLFICSIHAQQISSPDKFLGYPLGSKFSRHHQVVAYFNQLSKDAPKNVMIQEYGTTDENRPLFVAILSSEENIQNIENIRQQHVAMDPKESAAIVWLSYNVHGNESAGTEAAMLTAYELLRDKQEWLKNTIVIIDPCLNPDGRDRYVNWYYQVAGNSIDVDASADEHNEPWPSGRPNHYLFDLNRDWAWLTQTESKQRMNLYNQWLPHVHADFHEQGMNEPYYFAPAAEPFHASISQWQRDFQGGLGKNHASYFDKNGWLYFTHEIFDLLYPSYGDTYPSFNGAIGLTYEQGGSGRAGLGVIMDNGDTLSLKDRLMHHHTIGLSTIEYTHLNKQKLIDEFRIFADKAYQKSKYKTYVVGGNKQKMSKLIELLNAHAIKYSQGNGQTVSGFDYQNNRNGSMTATSDHLLISTKQQKGVLVNVLFEPKTFLSDTLTYDITAWSLPYAYGLHALASEKEIIGTQVTHAFTPNKVQENAYAIFIEWHSMNEARLLAELLKANLRVRYATNTFVMKGKKYERGTLVLLSADNPENFAEITNDLANSHLINIDYSMTGMSDSGSDMGSSAFQLTNNVNIALLTGEQTNSLNVGEIWHFFDKQINYPCARIDAKNLSAEYLQNIDVLILPDGNLNFLNDDGILSALKNWIEKGGKLIAIGSALDALASKEGFSIKSKGGEDNDSNKAEEDPRPEERHEHVKIKHADSERNYISESISGAIVQCEVDETHPLAYGYDANYATLKLNASTYEWLESGKNVVYLKKEPTIYAGFVGAKAKQYLSSSLSMGVEQIGQGAVIYFADNPLFRGFWENSKLFFVNALFFVQN